MKRPQMNLEILFVRALYPGEFQWNFAFFLLVVCKFWFGVVKGLVVAQNE